MIINIITNKYYRNKNIYKLFFPVKTVAEMPITHTDLCVCKLGEGPFGFGGLQELHYSSEARWGQQNSSQRSMGREQSLKLSDLHSWGQVLHQEHRVTALTWCLNRWKSQTRINITMIYAETNINMDLDSCVTISFLGNSVTESEFGWLEFFADTKQA